MCAMACRPPQAVEQEVVLGEEIRQVPVAGDIKPISRPKDNSDRSVSTI